MDKLAIDNKDVTSLNVSKLRDNMLKSIYTLEAALFNQAGYEYERVQRSRQIIDKVEKELFDDHHFNNLEKDQKITLYRLASSNMHQSMNFLGLLHNNVASGLETLNHIEKLKFKEKISEKINPSKELSEVKQAILKQIKSRVSE